MSLEPLAPQVHGEADRANADCGLDCGESTACISLDYGVTKEEHSLDSGTLQVSEDSYTPDAKHERNVRLSQALMVRSQELKVHYHQTWVFEDVEERIKLIRDALALVHHAPAPIGLASAEREPDPDFEVVIAGWLELSFALGDRYQHIGHLEDVVEQIHTLRRALGTLSDSSTRTALIKRELGAALRERFLHSGDVTDILEAVQLHSSLLNEHIKNQVGYHWVLYELGNTLFARFRMFGDVDDLARSITLQTEAVELFPESDPWRFLPQMDLARSLRTHSYRAQDVLSLDGATSILLDIIHTQPSCHRDHYQAYVALGLCMQQLYVQTGDVAYLNKATANSHQALVLQDIRHTSRPYSLYILAVALHHRYFHLGAIADIQQSICLLREAFSLPGKAEFRNDIITRLGGILANRYDALGDLNDLDESIMLLRDASKIHPGYPGRPLTLNFLGHSLDKRLRAGGKAADRSESLDLHRESAALFSGYWDTPVFHLVMALSEHFESTRCEEYLEEALAICESRLAKSQDQGNAYVYFCYIFAKVLTLRFDCQHRVESLVAAVGYYESVLKLLPTGSIYHHRSLLQLASTLRRRFEVMNAMEDVDRAAESLTDALRCFPDGHPERATILFESARLYLLPGTPISDISYALERLSLAVTDYHQNPQTRLTSALDVLQRLENQVSLSEQDHALRQKLLDVYTSTADLLPRVAYFGLDLESRLRALANSDKLAANGAAHALLLANPQAAVELLEQGRAVFWSQHLRLRTTFNALPPDLSGELTRAAFLLQRGSLSEVKTADDNQDKAAQEIETAKRRRLGDNFEALIQQARALPGFERFMLPEPFQALCAATAQGPVAILLANNVTCQAIVIENAETVHQVQLPDMSLQDLQTLSHTAAVSIHRGRKLLRGRAMKTSHAKNAGQTAEEVLQELWQKVVRRIIDTIHLKQAQGRNRPRLTLCPTGVFTHLPLHAAGVYRDGDVETIECISDYCVPSYTPTIGALLNARRGMAPTPITEAKMLLATVSKPYKWNPLPFVADEIKLIRIFIPSNVPLDYLGDVECPGINAADPATMAAVLKKLPDAAILHLACHGYQDPHNALNSGFVMQDTMLTAEMLMALNLDKGFLAFLSACETAKGDKAQPDQAIHLAATMLLAGFRSVVGTMWSMDDIDGPTVAKTVYEELFRGEGEMLDHEAIPYALDLAVQKLRARGLSASRWAPYVHYGV